MVGGLTRIQHGMRSWSGQRRERERERERERVLYSRTVWHGQSETESLARYFYLKNRSHWQVPVSMGASLSLYPSACCQRGQELLHAGESDTSSLGPRSLDRMHVVFALQAQRLFVPS